MKKIICSLLTILILINSAFVICYADDESFVTRAVNAVKGKIDIPVNYDEFNSKVTFEPGSQYAYLTWYGDDGESSPGGQINVTVDDKLRILSFSRYFYGEFNGNYKLSSYTSKDAEDIAKSFISKACPEFYGHTKLAEQEYSVHRNFEPYEFKFVRYENGLPCYDNYINVTVDASKGVVSAFDVKWIDYHKVYPANTRLTPAEAEASMYANIGMVKEYAQKPNGEIFVRYADLSDGINYINAYTGNIVNTNYVSEGSYKNALTAEKKFDFYYSSETFEIDYPVSVVEGSEYIAPGSEFTLTGIQYLQDDYGRYLYMYYDDFNGSVKTYIVDVYNGDVRYFDYYQHDIGAENVGLNQQQCEKVADGFVLRHNSSFIENCRLLNSNNQKNYIGEDVYYFNYTRFINDIAYDENGVIVGVSRSTGKIVSVTSGWDVIEVPQYSFSLSVEEAFDKYRQAVETSFNNEKDIRVLIEYYRNQYLINSENEKPVPVSSVRYLLKKSGLKLVHVTPRQSDRVSIDLDKVCENYFYMKEHYSKKVPSCLFFNCDECGCNGTEKHSNKYVIVPKSFKEKGRVTHVSFSVFSPPLC